MKVQFLYHPENDSYIASEIIKAINMGPTYTLDGLKISDIDLYNEDLSNAILKSDIIVLLVNTTFKKIAPAIWFRAVQNEKAIFAIDCNGQVKL